LISFSSTVESLNDGVDSDVAAAGVLETPAGTLVMLEVLAASSCLGVAVVRTYSLARGGDVLALPLGLDPAKGCTSAAEATVVGVAVVDLAGDLGVDCAVAEY
jgi:hypothetical protein